MHISRAFAVFTFFFFFDVKSSNQFSEKMSKYFLLAYFLSSPDCDDFHIEAGYFQIGGAEVSVINTNAAVNGRDAVSFADKDSDGVGVEVCIGGPSGIRWGDNVRETVGSSPVPPSRQVGLAVVML